MVSRVLLLLSGLVLGLALFAEPASAGGRHNRSGSCVGCNLKPSKVVNTSSKVHHTRVVHHTKVIPTTRVVNHNRLVLHKQQLSMSSLERRGCGLPQDRPSGDRWASRSSARA